MRVPRYITVKEACSSLRCGVTKLYELMASGKVKAKKDGGRTLVDVASLNRYQTDLPDAALTTHRNNKRR